ncbi:BQ5605_C008g04941 [Microbotryum silenes-dioicae]|uniref:BQ5605_C008g04941 protein n=1 Tax=Microbotryum silenes-dioicae TaxID=796604 RepID=A0A2X0MG98_9BASI|nr:BQ5605_C008g04941 [Microbotryum silenes-dioicae]
MGPAEAGFWPRTHVAVNDDLDTPVIGPFKDSTQLGQSLLPQLGDRTHPTGGLLLRIGEGRVALALHERFAGLAVLGLGEDRTGGVADRRSGLAGGVEGFDEVDRDGVYSQVDRGSVL